MKTRYRYLLLYAVVLSVAILSGCKTQHVAYHSTADIPYYTDATNTQMTLVVGDEDAAEDRDYVVFVATDDQSTPYVLLAPYTGNSSSAGYSFANANLTRAVPLRDENLDTLIDAARRASGHWSQDDTQGEGTFVEFVHAPEQDIRRVSENVIEWNSAIRFTFSHVPDGSSARMVLGDSPDEQLQYVVEFKEQEEVVDFQDVLETARGQL